jgi:hypothetical protein
MIDLRFLPTRAEFNRARSTPRAYVVVDGTGLRWVPRPVTSPPRPRNDWSWIPDRLEPPTVRRRWSSEAVAERVIADAYPLRAEDWWTNWRSR